MSLHIAVCLMVVARQFFITVYYLRHTRSIMLSVLLSILSVYPFKDMLLTWGMRYFYRTIGFEHFGLVLCLIFVLILFYHEVSLHCTIVFECWCHYDFIAVLRCDLLLFWNWVVECSLTWRCPLLVNDLRLFIYLRVEVVLMPWLLINLYFFH